MRLRFFTFSARVLNWIAAGIWLLLIPIALEFGWLKSVVFVSAISLYANVASHVSAALAADDREMLTKIDAIENRLEGIEKILKELLERG